METFLTGDDSQGLLGGGLPVGAITEITGATVGLSDTGVHKKIKSVSNIISKLY